MDWLLTLLIWVVFGAILYTIVRYLIMPVVPGPVQNIIWAVIGLVLLIVVVYNVGPALGWRVHAYPH